MTSFTFGTISFTRDSIKEFSNSIVPNNGGAIVARNGNLYIFSHCQNNKLFYMGEWLKEKEFIAEMDKLCNGKERHAYLVCCDPGRFSGRTLQGKYVCIRHVLREYQFPKETTVYTSYTWGGELTVSTDKPPLRGWRALLFKRIF